MTIDGGGSVTLSGGDATRLFFIESGASLELRDITLSGGNGEGQQFPGNGVAIYNDGGSLTISGSNLNNNHAGEFSSGGAIANVGGGELVIIGSTLSDNHARSGGAIASREDGPITIVDSTLTGNQVDDDAGAIYYSSRTGTVAIISSTLSENVAASNGGAILTFGVTTITNSTLSRNVSGHPGGAVFNLGDLTITNSTLVGNQGGLDVDGVGAGAIYNGSLSGVNLKTSIIADNELENCTGFISSQGYNVSDDESCSLGATGDRENTDPLLDVLDDYGGPTQTHRPLLDPDSPVIDAVPLESCAVDEHGNRLTDQRGIPRPQPANGNCDIGSVEYTLYPIISAVTPIPDTIQPGGSAVITVTAIAGPDGGEDPETFQYAFDCDNDDIFDVGPQNETSATCSPPGMGGYAQINVLVTDGASREVRGMTSVAIAYRLCVNQVTGEIREVFGAGCAGLERPISLPDDGGVTFCANRVTRVLRVAPTGGCTRSEVTLPMPEDGPVTVCVHRVSQVLRLPSNGTCTRYEVAREIGGG